MKVAVVMGGPSSEAAVSRASAAGVAGALERAGHEVVRVEMTRSISATLAAGWFDVVFPLVHGALGEDGCLQGLLEISGLPYVGSGVLASALAMDKVAAKRAYRDVGLPVARELVAGADTTARAVFDELGPDVVVKPSAAGSAVGVTPVRGGDDAALATALAEALRFGDAVLCEELVVGRELTCGVTDVIALGGLSPLPVTEIKPKLGEFYDFSSKYGAGGSEHVCPAELADDVTSLVQSLALRAHVVLGCRDLSRTDLLLRDDGSLVVLETNTLPGMTATSLYPEAMAARGVSFEAMCDAFVHAAKARRPREFGPVLELP